MRGRGAAAPFRWHPTLRLSSTASPAGIPSTTPAREATMTSMGEQLWRDLRVAARTLLKARGFASTVVATLALAIALETSVLAVVNAYLVRSLPYPAADRLYHVAYSPPGQSHPPGLEELSWDALSPVVEHPIAWDLDMFYLTGGDYPEAAQGAWVTPGFMRGLGIRPAIGR